MMKDSSGASRKPLQGVAALFDDYERKEIFRKYLFFLGWVEVFIFAGCWLYQLGDGGYDRFGPIEIPFPWKVYFLISFLAPVAITFLVGVVIIGFNKYFAEPEAEEGNADDVVPSNLEKSGRAYKLFVMANWLQRLPYLGLLLLLSAGVGIFYKMDAILGFLGNVGEKSVKALFIFSALLLLVAAVLGVVLLVVNFKLRKKSMEYRYKSEMAERFGLIILEDNSVLNSEGRLLIDGKKRKDIVPLLPARSSESPSRPDQPAGALHPTADFK